MTISVVAFAVVGGQHLVSRSNFNAAKRLTLANIASGASSLQQGRAILEAIEQIEFGTRFQPILAFSGMKAQPNGRVYLWVDWVVAHNQIDGVQFRLKSGRIVESKLTGIYRDGGNDFIYCHDGLMIDTIGLSDSSEIEAVSLTVRGSVVTDWIAPTDARSTD